MRLHTTVRAYNLMSDKVFSFIIEFNKKKNPFQLKPVVDKENWLSDKWFSPYFLLFYFLLCILGAIIS